MTPRGALVLATLAGTSPIEIGVRSGSELPFHATAQGRVMLAFAPRPFQARILSRRLEAFTDKTITSAERIEKTLLDIAKRGYASAPEESMLGLNARSRRRFSTAMTPVSPPLPSLAPIQFVPDKPKQSDIDALIKASQQISRKLGHGHLQENHLTKMRSRTI